MTLHAQFSASVSFCDMFGACGMCLQIEENLKALEVLPKLTPDVMERIDSIMENKPAPPTVYR